MDILFFCRDGLYDSLINQLTLAMSFQKTGKKVGVVFTGDALNCLSQGVIKWPDSLSDMETRKMILSRSKEMGLSLQNTRDPKTVDISPLLLQAKESGVLLFACPIWSGLLKLTGKVPNELDEIAMGDLLDELNSSSKVIGAL